MKISPIVCTACIVLASLNASICLAQNHALRFDGEDDYVDCGQSEAVQNAQTRDITIECWVKTRVEHGIMVTNRHEDDGSDFPTLMIENSHAVFAFDDRNYRQDCTSLHPVNDGEWHHIAGTKDGSSWKIYVDGEEAGSMDDNHELSGSRYNLHFGHHGAWGDYQYSGLIDEVRIWDYARSGEEVQQTMSVNLSGDEDGLIGYWRLDDGEGQTVADTGPNGYDGTLGNSDGQDNQDPEWVDSDAPIYGGTLDHPDALDFGPMQQGDDKVVALSLVNSSQEQDQWHGINLALSDIGDGPDWLEVETEELHLDAGEEAEVMVSGATAGLDFGQYERTVHIDCDAANVRSIDIPTTIWVTAGAGRFKMDVSDFRDQSPLEGALVRLFIPDGVVIGEGLTDAQGEIRFDEVPAYTYSASVELRDFLSRSWDDVEIADNSETWIQIQLQHSEFALDPAAVAEELHTGRQRHIPLTLTNDGNGPLTWNLSVQFPGGVFDPWERRDAIQVEQRLDLSRAEGVVFANDSFYVSGAIANQGNQIFVTDRECNLIRAFDQPGASIRGLADLDFDGENLWGAGGSDHMAYCFSTDGDSITSFRSPINRSVQAIAWDSDRDLLWIAELTSDIIGVDREGHEQARLDRGGLQINGLAYWPGDPDGHNLYIFNDLNDAATVSKLNTANGDIQTVRNLSNEVTGLPRGAFITPEYDINSWVLMTVANATDDEGGDRVDLWQLAQNTGWVGVDPLSGVVAAGDSDQLSLTLNSDNLRNARYQAGLVFMHDGVGGRDSVGVTMDVNDEEEEQPPTEFDLATPADNAEFDCSDDNDTLITFSWTTSFDPNPSDTVAYHLLVHALIQVGNNDVSRYADFETSDTAFAIGGKDLDSALQDSGRDDAVFTSWSCDWVVEAIAGDDTTAANAPRSFTLTDGGIRVSDITPQPIEFELIPPHPNPFNSRLSLSYSVDRPGLTRMAIYDVAGRLVAEPVSGMRRPGSYDLTWDAAGMPGGVYIVRIESAGQVKTQKVVLLK